MKIPGGQTLNGTVAAPGSKAYTHRALFAALLSKGKTSIVGPSQCDDTQKTLSASQALGANVVTEKHDIVSKGVGRISPESEIKIDCGDSGTTLRLLTAVAATSPRLIRLSVSPSLAQRPLAPLLNSISELGASASIDRTEIIVKGPMKGGETWIEGNVSSQFVSGLLFAAPLAESDVTIRLTNRLQSKPYVEMTLDILGKHDIKIEKQDDGYHIPAPQEYRPASHNVPGDFSSASFIIAGAGMAGGEVTITGLNGYAYEPDEAIVKVLEEIGAETHSEGDSLTVKKTRLSAFRFDASDNPDLVPPLQVLGTFAEGESEITGVDRLRFKETNRLETVTAELVKMGAKLKADHNRIRIHGTNKLHGSDLNSQGDHRVAMACGIAALAADGESELDRAEVVSKSYPEFFQDLSTLGAHILVE